MNIAKNMEAIFVVAIALASFGGMATASRPPVEQNPVRVAATTDANVQVVTVSARRMTAAEKAAAQ